MYDDFKLKKNFSLHGFYALRVKIGSCLVTSRPK